MEEVVLGVVLGLVDIDDRLVVVTLIGLVVVVVVD